MPHINPRPRDELAEFKTYFGRVEEALGFVPNSFGTMGHRPAILRGFASLAGAVLGQGTVDPGLKQLVALMASTSGECRYCQAHTAAMAPARGVAVDKIEAVYEFESSPLYSDAERAAIGLARDAAIVPNAVTAEHFEALRPHFDDGEIVEIVAVISLFGWLNRWNDTMATELEHEPLTFASEHLARHGWESGKHTPAASE